MDGFLVLDNVDDIRIFGNSSDVCYLPDTCSEGHNLIRSRDPNAKGIPEQGAEVLEFSPTEAVECLLVQAKISPSERKTDDVQMEASKMVKELAYLPLAIEQAAAYIREQYGELSKYLNIYVTHRTELLRIISLGN